MSSQEISKRKVKNIFQSPFFQLKFISYFIALFVISTISLYSTTYLFFWKFKTKGATIGIPPEHIFFKFLENQKGQLDYLFIGLAIFNFCLLMIVGLIISHRIAAPLNKIEEHLENLSASSEDLKLRDSDFLKELAPSINELRKKLK